MPSWTSISPVGARLAKRLTGFAGWKRMKKNKNKEQHRNGCCSQLFLDVPNFSKALKGLRDLDGLGDFLLRFGLRHGDGQDAVLHLG
jgi:hypothetical protein